MARTNKVEEGQSFRLKAGDGLGTGPGMLLPGQEVTVRETVPANESGAHDNSEDAVVVEWTEPGILIDPETGNMTRGEVPRAVSIGVSQFSDLFEEA